MQEVSILEILKNDPGIPILDVRSPAEFKDGHIPGAYSLPLFSDDERKRVGITYKHEGQRAAIKLGLKIVGPKMNGLVEFVESMKSESVAVHCWRGGMRSASVAWLLETAGFNVAVVEGGYKSFRRAMIDFFSKPLPLIVLGGATGSGKTEILHKLSEAGEQVVDLEGLANHRGSAFGSFGLPPQPTTEQFQNDLFLQFINFDPSRRIWVEDESSYIGKVGLPEGLWRQMSRAKMVMLDVPLELRIERLVNEYGNFPKHQLSEAISKIGKKLGGQHKKKAIESLHTGKLKEVAKILLTYYDKSYHFLEQKRNQTIMSKVQADTADAGEIADHILKSENYIPT